MSVEVLSLGYTDPAIGCPKERWWEVFRPFDAKARYHAANLAAHNWDVLLVEGRVFLFQTRYGGVRGHWLNPDCSRVDATLKEQSALYTNTMVRRFTAQGIEARSGETTKIGSTEGESPVAKPCAPNLSPSKDR